MQAPARCLIGDVHDGHDARPVRRIPVGDLEGLDDFGCGGHGGSRVVVLANHDQPVPRIERAKADHLADVVHWLQRRRFRIPVLLSRGRPSVRSQDGSSGLLA